MNIPLIIINIIIIKIIILLTFYNFVFLRDPKRTIPKGNAIVAPADGTIVKILELQKNNIKKLEQHYRKKGLWGRVQTTYADTIKQGYAIFISMNIFDVHYQYAPIEGKVKNIKYEKGKFLNAVYGTESLQTLENEKNSIIISNKKLKIKVIQVAGLMARRIVCFVKEKQMIKKGQKLGIIKLGSMAIVVIPKLTVRVKEGQKTVGGETIIAA